MKTSSLVKKLKQDNSDFEWYPTTKKMIEVIRRHIYKKYSSGKDFIYVDGINKTPCCDRVCIARGNYNEKLEYYKKYAKEGETVEYGYCPSNYSILDIGAGDGRVLSALQNGKMYAIEKSPILQAQHPEQIFPLGSDFKECNLIDKNVDVTFCNPPYSEYSEWASKIINESRSNYIYLVIPSRWKDNKEIKSSLEYRGATADTIFSGDFKEADRKARAKIDILFIDLTTRKNKDPFDVWFDNEFSKKLDNSEISKYEKRIKDDKETKQKIQNELVKGNNIIDILSDMYVRDMSKTYKTYKAISELDYDILDSLDVKKRDIKEAIKVKLEGTKNKYWNELFDRYTPITNRLTTGSKNKIMSKLTGSVCVDFTVANAYAVTGWALKYANSYIDEQAVNIYEKMNNIENVRAYKSNIKTFKKEEWKNLYSFDYKEKLESLKYYLDYRIVVSRVGGVYQKKDNYGLSSSYDYPNNLSKRAHDFINDLLVLAKNFGWTIPDSEKSENIEWESNKKVKFTPFEVRAFMNGNMHFRMNQKFMRQLNVHYGKMKAWIKDKEQAVEEIEDVEHSNVSECFSDTVKIGCDSVKGLVHQPEKPKQEKPKAEALKPQETKPKKPNKITVKQKKNDNEDLDEKIKELESQFKLDIF